MDARRVCDAVRQVTGASPKTFEGIVGGARANQTLGKVAGTLFPFVFLAGHKVRKSACDECERMRNRSVAQVTDTC